MQSTSSEEAADNFYQAPPYVKVLCGVTDHLPPDVQAMQQAAYSRSTKSIEDRVAETPTQMDKARAGLREFYVGWNHKSVGQLGCSTLWFEGVSQIAAKAIEDTQLFNGQECSTRYIDFTHQPIINFGNAEIALWQARWKALYMKALPLTIADLKLEFPFEQPEFKESEIFALKRILEQAQNFSVTDEEARVEGIKKATRTWENTIKARAFDICRSLITCGATTNVSFAGTFDNMNDQFGQLLYHPSSEVRDLAKRGIEALQAKYPDATPGIDKLRQRNAHVTSEYFYQPTWSFWDDTGNGHYAQPAARLELVGGKLTDDLIQAIGERKIYQRLPRHLSASARVKMIDELDFGSFRDLHRHRPGTCLMPLVMPLLGFHQWYLEELPPVVAVEAVQLLREQTASFRDRLIEDGGVELQYCLPMGLKVPISYECDINQLLYILERRSDKTVHQTLRQMVHRQGGFFQGLIAKEVGSNAEYVTSHGVHIDYALDNWTLKRGTQTTAEETKA